MKRLNIMPSKLLTMASEVMGNAYCPYSRYSVGASLLAYSGKVFTGCNMENASLGLTICAERVAFANAISSGIRKFVAIAIVTSGAQLPYPCGACRQIMTEFCSPDFKIYVASSTNIQAFVKLTLAELLPYSFRL